MLSRLDIEKELGKGINIHPIRTKNFKENSINLCVGKHAWAMQDGVAYFDFKKERFVSNHVTGAKRIEIAKGTTAVFWNGRKYYVALLPRSTTLIETREVLAVGSNIGGTYHSKVGLVSQGVGHIGTMLGPNFSGYSLIAIHNMTDDIITLNGGESFVSVVFHYLNTPVVERNPTVSGHVDKMAELGIKLTTSERDELTADWCGKIEEVRRKMLDSEEYKSFKKKQKERKTERWKTYFSLKNIIIVAVLLLILAGLGAGAYYADKVGNTNDWKLAYASFVSSTVLVTIVMKLIGSLGK